MNNTIPSVPRELLADLLGNDHDKRIMAERHLLAMLANAPSPAGVDGLEVVGYVSQDDIEWKGDCTLRLKPYSDYQIPLCRLSDAQAIIDGLRGEVDKLMTTFVRVADHLHIDCEKAKSAPGKPSDVFIAAIDQQAQRIGELEAALEFACKSLAQVTSSDGSGHADIAVSVLRMAGRKEIDASQIVEAYKAGAKWRIDAALSAGKEVE